MQLKISTHGLFLRMSGIYLLVVLIFFGNFSLAKETGLTEYSVNAAGTRLDIFAYHPPECKETDILVVFHGFKRKAKLLRKKAVPVAKQLCLTVFAPRFDKKRFPNWRYHRAGVYRSGHIQPRKRWTGPILQALLGRLREIAGNKSSRLYLFGHSAGGQFLSRISAYSSTASIVSIVIANPSMYVLPDLDTNAPVGFAGLFSEFEAKQRLKTYLGLPISIYLGRNDTGEKYLVKSPEAMKQGQNRLERGRYVYQFAKQVARSRGWEFNWKLIEVPGVGHSSDGLLRASELLIALRLTNKVEEKGDKHIAH